jgi:hypothetical protein
MSRTKVLEMRYSTSHSTRVCSNKNDPFLKLFRDIKADEKHHIKFILNWPIDREHAQVAIPICRRCTFQIFQLSRIDTRQVSTTL